jgi:hypothetical protein
MITNLSAQDKAEPRENSLQEGAWALQFAIDRDFQLRSFQGATISLKKHRSDGSAWRLGLGLALDFDTGEDFSTSGSGYTADSDANSQAISLVIQKIIYTAPDAPMNFFYGYGPTSSYSHSSSTRTIIYPSSGTNFQEKEKTRHSFSAGISGAVGVEWFPTRSISILAEYGTAMTFSTSKSTDTIRESDDDGDTQRTAEKVSNGFSLTASAVKFGLSAYF